MGVLNSIIVMFVNQVVTSVSLLVQRLIQRGLLRASGAQMMLKFRKNFNKYHANSFLADRT